MRAHQVIGYGMNERVGPIAFNPNEESSGRPYRYGGALLSRENFPRLLPRPQQTNHLYLVPRCWMRMTALTTSTHTHPHSENLAEIVDEEVREMVKKAYATTRALLQDKYEGLKQVRQPLSHTHTHSLSSSSSSSCRGIPSHHRSLIGTIPSMIWDMWGLLSVSIGGRAAAAEGEDPGRGPRSGVGSAALQGHGARGHQAPAPRRLRRDGEGAREALPRRTGTHSSHSVFPLRLECAKLQNSGVQQQLTAAPLSSSSFAGAHPAARAGAPGSRRVINASQRDTAPALMTMSSTFLRPYRVPRQLHKNPKNAATKTRKSARRRIQLDCVTHILMEDGLSSPKGRGPVSLLT